LSGAPKSQDYLRFIFGSVEALCRRVALRAPVSG
jgi:hypothetical protein